MELGAVHCLPYGDPTTSPTCHRIPSNPTADRKSAGCLGGRPPQDARGRHPLNVCTFTNRFPQVGVQRAQGSDFSQPGNLREAADGGTVDHGEGNGGRTSTRVAVHKDRGDYY